MSATSVKVTARVGRQAVSQPVLHYVSRDVGFRTA